MINQVIIAGRLIEDPRVTICPGEEARAELCLELDHFDRRLNEEAVEVERTLVLARMKGDQRVEVVKRYLSRDGHVVVRGHLRRDAEGVFVAVDRFEFMEHRLVTRPMWAPKADVAPPQPQIVPAAPAPAEVKAAPKVAVKPIKRATPKVAAA